MDPSALCRENMGALVTDGANAVCDRFAPAPLVGLALGLTIAVGFVWRVPGAWRDRLLAATVVLAGPGFLALAARRADAPALAWTTAARLEGMERAIEDDANATGCAPRTFPCAACEPIARYARSRAPSCRSAGASEITSRGDRACEGAKSELVCGAR